MLIVWNDLTAAIELFNTLIGRGRYEDAFNLYSGELSYATIYRLSANRQNAELLEMFFRNGVDELPFLNSPRSQSYVLNDLALSSMERPGRAAALFRRCIGIDEKEGDQISVSVDLRNMSDALRFSGALRDSEAAARRALLISRQLSDQEQQSMSLYYLGLALAAQGRKVR